MRELEAGNTELLAAILQRLTGGDCFCLEPVSGYFAGLLPLHREGAAKEAAPKRKGLAARLPDDPVIYLGCPNYWSTLPMPVALFLEACDLSGKGIRPFCTHEGGGPGRSVTELQALCRGRRWGRDWPSGTLLAGSPWGKSGPG